jgi:myo-inositol catabolism protein IolS
VKFVWARPLRIEEIRSLLVSKCGVHWHDNGRVDMNNSPEVTELMLHRSLKDLQTEQIDLYMVHWPDERVDIRKTLEVLVKAKEQDKIRFIGLCNTNRDEIEKAREVCDVDFFQSEFSLTNQSAKEDLFPFIKDKAFMSWGTFDKGILTGRVTRDRKYDDVDCRKTAPWWREEDVIRKLDKVDKLEEYLKDKEYNLIHCALGFNLNEPNLITALCGARNSEQLNSLVQAYEKLPSGEKIEEIKNFFL